MYVVCMVHVCAEHMCMVHCVVCVVHAHVMHVCVVGGHARVMHACVVCVCVCFWNVLLSILSQACNVMVISWATGSLIWLLRDALSLFLTQKRTCFLRILLTFLLQKRSMMKLASPESSSHSALGLVQHWLEPETVFDKTGL